MGIKNDIRESADYQKFKKIMLRTQKGLQVERDRTEALSMHAGRTSRKLYGMKQYSPKALMDASLNDMSVRSRLVELRVNTSVQKDMLHEAVKAMKQSILTNFGDQLKPKFKTIGERTAFLDNLLATALEIEHEGEAFIKLLDSLVADIDKASFHLRTMSDALQLLDQSKGGKVI